VKRIDIEDDAVEYADDMRLLYRGEPFTGEAVELVGEQLLTQQFYVEGIRHGPEREWWLDGGALKSEGEMRHGSPVGVYRAWHHNGQLAEEREFGGDGRVTVARKWDKDGNPVDVPRRAR